MPKINFTAIPETLRRLPHWVGWDYEQRAGEAKKTKVPCILKTGSHADSTDPATWSDWDAARKYAKMYDGIGFVLTPETGLVGIDLDDCIDGDGRPNAYAHATVERFKSYTEVTPSGNGLRLFIHGHLPGSRCSTNGVPDTGKVEVYQTARFLTLTGRPFNGSPPDIREAQEELNAWYAEVFPPEPPRVVEPWSGEPPDDDEILRLAFAAKNGASVESLYRGDTSSHAADDSAADLALCAHLAFYAGPHGQQAVDALFRRSGLMREKWDERRGQRTYGELTIGQIYETATTFYEAGDAVDLSPFKHPVVHEETKRFPPEVAQREDFPTEPFPVRVLPSVLSRWIEEVSRVIQVPNEQAGMLGLAALAAVTSRRFEVRIGHTHEEPLCLYVAIAAQPGTRKSQTLTQMTFPLRDAQKRLLREHKEACRSLEHEVAAAENEIAKLKRQLLKESTDEGRAVIQEKIRVERQQAPELPPRPRLIVDDVTQERLAQIMIDQGGCLGMFSDEGGIFDILAGRYSSGVNLDLFLKAHDAGTFQTDRLNRDYENLERACLTIGLCVQPAVIQQVLGDKKEFKGRGLMGRFFFVLPQDLRGTRIYDSRQPGLDPDARHEYEQMMLALLRYPQADSDDVTVMHTLRITGAALEVHEGLLNIVEQRQGIDGDLRAYSDWASKLGGRVARIAGSLHCLLHMHERPEAVPIEVETVKSAWQIGAYLIGHMRWAYGITQDSPMKELARKIEEWARRRGKSFDSGDVIAGMRRHADGKAVKESVQYLVENLRLMRKPQKNEKTGRESQVFELCEAQEGVDAS